MIQRKIVGEQFDPYLLIEILLLLIEFNLRKLRKNPYFLTYYSIFKFNKMSRKIYNYNIPWIMAHDSWAVVLNRSKGEMGL